MASNYGDYRLKLPANWSRANCVNRQFLQTTIGHNNGVSEVRLTKNPEQVHAFGWVDPRNEQDFDLARDDGWALINKADWTADRWSWLSKGDHPEWNAEGSLYCQGLLLMAMTAERWDALDAERKRNFNPQADPINEQLLEFAERAGAHIDAPAVARKPQPRL